MKNLFWNEQWALVYSSLLTYVCVRNNCRFLLSEEGRFKLWRSIGKGVLFKTFDVKIQVQNVREIWCQTIWEISLWNVTNIFSQFEWKFVEISLLHSDVTNATVLLMFFWIAVLHYFYFENFGRKSSVKLELLCWEYTPWRIIFSTHETRLEGN